MDAVFAEYAVAAPAAVAYMTAWYLLAMFLKRLDLGDAAWGLGVIVLSVVALIRHWPIGQRPGLLVLLVIIWGGRLTLHVVARMRRRAEDFRYARWHEGSSRLLPLRAYALFLGQAVALLVVAAPIVVTAATDTGSMPGLLDVLGYAMWALGFYFEAASDWQLTCFALDSDNRGGLLTGGLWRYSRHPNLFGETMQWWGLWVIALSAPLGWVAVVSPLAVTVTLLFITGVPPLERHLSTRPGWVEYVARTSMFVPLPPKR